MVGSAALARRRWALALALVLAAAHCMETNAAAPPTAKIVSAPTLSPMGSTVVLALSISKDAASAQLKLTRVGDLPNTPGSFGGDGGDAGGGGGGGFSDPLGGLLGIFGIGAAPAPPPGVGINDPANTASGDGSSSSSSSTPGNFQRRRLQQSPPPPSNGSAANASPAPESGGEQLGSVKGGGPIQSAAWTPLPASALKSSSVTLTGLPSGSFRAEVRALDESGSPGPSSGSYPFQVDPSGDAGSGGGGAGGGGGRTIVVPGAGPQGFMNRPLTWGLVLGAVLVGALLLFCVLRVLMRRKQRQREAAAIPLPPPASGLAPGAGLPPPSGSWWQRTSPNPQYPAGAPVGAASYYAHSEPALMAELARRDASAAHRRSAHEQAEVKRAIRASLGLPPDSPTPGDDVVEGRADTAGGGGSPPAPGGNPPASYPAMPALGAPQAGVAADAVVVGMPVGAGSVVDGMAVPRGGSREFRALQTDAALQEALRRSMAER